MARNLDGTGDYFTIPNNALLSVGDTFTYGLWYKRSVTSDNYSTFFTKRSSSSVLVIGAAGSNEIELYKDSSGLIVKSTISITDTGWHQLTVAKNGATSCKIYSDGVDVSGVVTDRTCSTNSEIFYIGVDGGGAAGSEFQGDLGEIGIWSRALSLAEAQGLAKGFSPLFYKTGLNVYFPLIGNLSPEPDLKNGLSATLVGTCAKAAHPRIIYPANYNLAPFSTAAAASAIPQRMRMGIGY